MKEVVRYECEYCKKDFKTPNRHICKFDPKFKNCHSCKHCRGWEEEMTEYDTWHGTSEQKMLWPICVKKVPDSSDYTALGISNYYSLNCSEYDWCGSTWYKYCSDNNLLYEDEPDCLDPF